MSWQTEAFYQSNVQVKHQIWWTPGPLWITRKIVRIGLITRGSKEFEFLGTLIATVTVVSRRLPWRLHMHGLNRPGSPGGTAQYARYRRLDRDDAEDLIASTYEVAWQRDRGQLGLTISWLVAFGFEPP